MDELTYMTKKEIDAKYDRIGKCGIQFGHKERVKMSY